MRRQEYQPFVNDPCGCGECAGELREELVSGFGLAVSLNGIFMASVHNLAQTRPSEDVT